MSVQTAVRRTASRSVPRRLRAKEQAKPDFIPVSEAATSLGVSTATVRRLFDARKLPGYLHGRNRQILRTFVDGFVAEVKAGRQPNLNEYADAWFKQAEAVAS